MRKDLLIVLSIFCGLSLCLFFISRAGLSPFWMGGKIAVPSELSILHFISKPDDISLLAELKKDNASLTQQLSDLKQVEQENKTLRAQFETSPIHSSKLLPATIVGEPGFLPGVSFPAYIVLDKGTDNGVVKDQVVLVINTVIGKVIEVNPGFSKVMLVSDPSISITARTQGTNAQGIVKGQSNGDLLFDNVLLADSLKLGDIIVTNGDQGMDGKGYPPGLLLGKITSVEKNPSALFQKASVASLIDMSKLRMVFVLIK